MCTNVHITNTTSGFTERSRAASPPSARTLATFARPSSWSAAFSTNPLFKGSPTPAPNGALWADGAALDDLLLFDGTGWSSHGGIME
jgi:hypothetical protein